MPSDLVISPVKSPVDPKVPLKVSGTVLELVRKPNKEDVKSFETVYLYYKDKSQLDDSYKYVEKSKLDANGNWGPISINTGLNNGKSYRLLASYAGPALAPDSPAKNALKDSYNAFLDFYTKP